MLIQSTPPLTDLGLHPSLHEDWLHLDASMQIALSLVLMRSLPMIDLSQFDDPFAESFSKLQAATIPTTSVIPNGIYTLSFPCGTHRAFRVFTKPENSKFAPGKRIIALLIGPDNTEDYDPFGFVDDEGIHVWKRFKNQRQAEYADLLWLLATGCEADGHSLLISKRCLRCNRTLTDPLSLELGIGPTCRGA